MKLKKVVRKFSFIFVMLVILLTLFSVNKNINVKAEENTYTSDSIIKWVMQNDLPDGNYNVTVTGSTDGGETNETITYPVELINYYDDVTYTISDEKNGMVSLGDDSDEYKMLVVKYHKNLTIDEGVTLTANTHTTTIDGTNYELTYKKGMYIHVSGTLTNNGTISMTERGTYNQEGENVYLWKNDDNTFEYVPAIGGAGGLSSSISGDSKKAGNSGKNGSSRSTGGGGSGAARSYSGRSTATSGSGAKGTSYSGGSGGGASNTGHTSATSMVGSENGGKGGAGIVTTYSHSSTVSWSAGGGAGNPGGIGQSAYSTAIINNTKNNGTTGTGGLLILYTKECINNGLISSNGNIGGIGVTGGGSSGGGSINIFYLNKMTNNNVEVTGGASVNNGGSGGNGTITYKALPIFSSNNNLKSLSSNH